MRRARALSLAFAATALLTLLPGPALAQAAAPPDAPRTEMSEELALAVGETKVLSAKDIRNYSTGATDIIDVKLTSDSTQFVVRGQKAGSTTLLLIKNDGSTSTYTVTVYPRSPDAVARELSQLLEGITGVRIRRIGARMFIEGSVPSEADLKRIGQIAALYPGQVESLAAIGTVGIERKILVRIDFYFAQYDKSSSYAVGINWPAAIGGDAVIQNQFAYDFVAKTSTTATATIVNQPLPSLDIASRNGWAKVFKQATIITSNGAEATFESGGEQNFSVNTGLTIGIQKIQFGAFVTINPVFDPQSRELDLKLDANVADLTAPVASTIPGRTTTKLSTNVHLKLGQSLVLSGIRTRSQTHDVSGIPLLSDIPVIGLFFGSHSDSVQDTDGAIFIVPSIIETVPKAASELIDNALKDYSGYHGDLSSVHPFDKRPPITVAPPAPAPPPVAPAQPAPAASHEAP